MYKCNCYAGKKLTYALKEVETYNDGICIKCGHYAIWEETDDKVTVFDQKRNLVGHFDSLDNAVEITGQDRIKIRTLLNRQGKGFIGKKYYYIKGITEDLEKYYSDQSIYVYNFKTQKYIGKFDNINKAVEKTKDTLASARANIQKRSQHSVQGYVYTKTKNFKFSNHSKIFNKEDQLYWDEYDFYEDVLDAKLLL